MTLKTGRLVIASGQSASTPLRLDSDTIVGLYMPAAWDTADVAFEASHDGTSFVEMQEFGAAVAIQAVAQKYVPLDFFWYRSRCSWVVNCGSSHHTSLSILVTKA